MRTFKCEFGNGVSCEVKMPDSLPEGGKSHILGVVWTGNPTSRVLRPYIAWFNSVNKQMADEWNAKLMHVFLTSPSTYEMWVYEPGSNPKMVERKSTK